MGRERGTLTNERLAVVAGLLYGLAVCLTLVLLSKYGGTVKSAGWRWDFRDQSVFVSSVDTESAVAGKLISGDRVLSVEGDARASEEGPRPWLQAVFPGMQYRVSIDREGELHDVTLTMSSKVSRNDMLMGLCDVLLSLGYGLAGLVLWWSRPDDRLVLWCYGAAMLMAFFLLGSALGPASQVLQGPGLWLFLVTKSIFPLHMVAGCFFFSRFPTGERPNGLWAKAEVILLVWGITAWAIGLWLRVGPHLSLEMRLPLLSGLDLQTRPELSMLPLRHGFAAACAVFLFCVAWWNYLRLTNPVMRLRVRWVIAGALLGVLPALGVSLVLAIGSSTGIVGPAALNRLVGLYSLATLGLILIPMAVTYAVLRERLMGIKVTLLDGMRSPGARRVLEFATLLPAFGMVYVAWRHQKTPLVQWPNEHPIAMLGMVVALFASACRREILRAVEEAAAGRPQREQSLRELQAKLSGLESDTAMAAAVASCLAPVLDTNRIAICRKEGVKGFRVLGGEDAPEGEGPGFALLRMLEQQCSVLPLTEAVQNQMPAGERMWLRRYGAVAAAPIYSERERNVAGVVLSGEKRSGESYRAVDLEFLEQAARKLGPIWTLRNLEKERDEAERGRQSAEEQNQRRIQVLAQMGHEIRQPLHGVVSLTGLLLDTDLSEEQEEYAQLIRRSSETMVELANDFLDLSRLEAGRLRLEARRFAWRPLLEDLMVTAAEVARKKDLEVVLIREDGLPAESVGDVTRIRQVLLNLLSNAVKFTDAGWIVLWAEGTPDGNGVTLEVQDTGRGIPEEARPRLFQPFEQACSVSPGLGGTGLGLSISKKLVEALGGSISFETQSRKGTTFRVELPVKAVSMKPQNSAPLRGFNVACVDGLSVRLKGVSTTLNALGASVHTGPDAATGRSYDVVTLATDLNVEATRLQVEEVRNHFGLIPVLLLRRVDRLLTAEQIRTLGNVAQVRRPVTSAALLRAVVRGVAQFQMERGVGKGHGSLRDSCKGVRVLVVDDDTTTAVTLQKVLGHLGCESCIAENAAQAMQQVKTQEFDLILMDGELPDIDGAQLTRRIRELSGVVGQTPVVGLSGHLDAEFRTAMLQAGAGEFLEKPVSVADLQAKVLAYARRNAAMRERDQGD